MQLREEEAFTYYHNILSNMDVMANRCSINYRVFINHNGITDSERHICELRLPAVPPGCAVRHQRDVCQHVCRVTANYAQAGIPPSSWQRILYTRTPAGRNKEFSRLCRMCASVFCARAVSAHAAGRVVDRVVFFEVSPTITRGTLYNNLPVFGR